MPHRPRRGARRLEWRIRARKSSEEVKRGRLLPPGAAAGYHFGPEHSSTRPRIRRMDSDKTGMTNGDSAGGHPPDLMSKLASLCKRRGFIFQSSEIYGGVGSVYDYGPVGVELKNNIRAAWWQEMVHRRPDVEGVVSDVVKDPGVGI